MAINITILGLVVREMTANDQMFKVEVVPTNSLVKGTMPRIRKVKTIWSKHLRTMKVFALDVAATPTFDALVAYLIILWHFTKPHLKAIKLRDVFLGVRCVPSLAVV